MEPPVEGQVLAHTEFTGDNYTNPPRIVTDIADANLITSLTDDLKGYIHKPVLDIDLPVKLVESSTPGHFHLFIDKELTWYEYCTLLHTLAQVGIVEHGFVASSIERGFSAVRLPWVKKGETDE